VIILSAVVAIVSDDVCNNVRVAMNTSRGSVRVGSVSKVHGRYLLERTG
jgi:hypothetical protein